MASANITKLTVAAFCLKYGVIFAETAEGGKVTVGAESKEFKYTDKGAVPPRTGLVSWLGERVPAIAKDFPIVKGKGKGAAKGEGKVSIDILSTDEGCAGFSIEKLETLREHLDSYIPARKEAEEVAIKVKAREELKEKLAVLGLNTPKEVFDFIKGAAADPAAAAKAAEIVRPEGKGKGKAEPKPETADAPKG
jgi:hypothetical protein